MARYIYDDEALQIIDSYAKTVTKDGKVVVDAIRDIVAVIAPAADVVPRSEVESLLEDIIERLAAEQTKEGQKADSAWESQDTLSYEVFGYAEDKLETIVLALTLLKNKYTGDKR